MRKSKTIYDPKADQVRPLSYKIDRVFTEHQKALLQRPDVTKSLIVALTKVVTFKQSIDTLTKKWVGQEVSKLMRTIPLLIIR